MAAKIEKYNPDGMAPPLGLYRHVARVSAAEYLYIAGQVAVDATGNLVGAGDIAAQTAQVLANLRQALRSAGADFANVVKFTTYMTEAADLPAYMSARQGLLAEHFPDGAYPPNTLLIIDRLVKEEFRIEVEAVAAL